MSASNPESIAIGVSSCLLGENVRFDSGHKKNAYITGVLLDYFDFQPFCPEVAIGLGTPREPVRLVAIDNDIRCRGTKNTELDVTDRLIEATDKKQSWHSNLCGYILKKDSPSCGMERVKIYSNGMPSKKGHGVYAKRMMGRFPHLPVEEEGRLEDPHLRENFIQRVYVYSRWKSLELQGITIGTLQQFHANHKYILMSHDQLDAKHLGALLADTTKTDLEGLASEYISGVMLALKKIATRKSHTNTLKHIQGYLKKHLGSDDKAELNEVIDDYKKGLLPLIVPITLLRHHFRRNPNDYITQSYYMSPHPGELMLLNNI